MGADETIVYDPWASSGSPAPLGLPLSRRYPARALACVLSAFHGAS